MDDEAREAVTGIRADIAVLYKELKAMHRSIDWLGTVSEWSALVALPLLGLILWRIW